MDHQDEPDTHSLLTSPRGCMPSRLVNNTGNFIPSSVFMEANPLESHTWVLKKFNINYPNIFTPHQEPAPDPATATATASLGINLNPSKNFVSVLKLPGLSPELAIAKGPK